jgi:hypothetical protein
MPNGSFAVSAKMSRHVLGQPAQLREHPLHATAGGEVAGVEVAGVLAADLD